MLYYYIPGRMTAEHIDRAIRPKTRLNTFANDYYCFGLFATVP